MTIEGNPVVASSGMTVSEVKLQRITNGDVLGDLAALLFRDPKCYRAGELHAHVDHWETIVGKHPTPQQAQVLEWIREKVSIFTQFHHYRGSFKGELYDSDRPPQRVFANNRSCQPFVEFIRKTLINRVHNGAISLIGRVGQVDLPHLVLPFTMEPTKPRLCYDARFLNLWIKDNPFQLDCLSDLPRYVERDSYQTLLDDKSGYDHILLRPESRQFFGIQWGGWMFVHNSLPVGWKTSPYIYHTTGLLVSNYFRSMRIPCSLYIDDRHTGQLRVSLIEGAYANFADANERRIAAAKSAIFLVAYHLVKLGYFLGLAKSIVMPRQVVPYLGFLVDSTQEVFHVIPANI